LKTLLALDARCVAAQLAVEPARKRIQRLARLMELRLRASSHSDD